MPTHLVSTRGAAARGEVSPSGSLRPRSLVPSEVRSPGPWKLGHPKSSQLPRLGRRKVSVGQPSPAQPPKGWRSWENRLHEVHSPGPWPWPSCARGALGAGHGRDRRPGGGPGRPRRAPPSARWARARPALLQRELCAGPGARTAPPAPSCRRWARPPGRGSRPRRQLLPACPHSLAATLRVGSCKP